MIPIDDNEAFRIRANAGDGPECDVNPIEPIPLITPLPPEVPCDDPPEPDTERFFAPTPAPTPAKQLRLPGSIKIHSPELEVLCPPGTTTEREPSSFVLEFGSITRTINFTDILGDDGQPLFDQTTLYNLYNVAGTIRDAVYSYLGPSAPSADPARAEYIDVNFSDKVTLLSDITKLPAVISEQFWNYILAQQGLLDASAQSLANRQLSCGFFNVPLWVVCFDQQLGEYRISYTPPFASGAVFVPSGVSFSAVDQATANALAIQTAVNVPFCQFESQAQEVTCAELFGGDFLDSVLFEWPTLQSPKTTKLSDIGGHVVLDKSGAILPRTKGYEALTYAEVASRGNLATKRELILKVSVPAGLTTGNTQVEADAKARAVALSYLDCFIPSRQTALKCTDEFVSEPAFEQAQSSSDDEVLSEIVTGYTTLANLLPTLKPDNVTILSSNSGPSIDTRVAVRLQVPAGSFVSDSREAADTEANSFALSSSAINLDCNWSNRRVTYACDDKIELVDAYNHLDDTAIAQYGIDGKIYDGPFEVNLKRGYITDIQNLGKIELMAIVDKSDPYFVSVEHGEFKSSTSQADADRIAAAHAMSLLNCVYCNPRIEPNCPPSGYELDDPLPLLPGSDGYSFDATRGIPGIPYLYDQSATPPRWRIIDDAGKVPQDPIESEAWICSTDPVDVVRVSGDDSGVALRTLDTSLECRYCNDQVTAACCASADTDENTYIRFGPEQCAQLANAFDNFTVGECAGNQISDPYNTVVVPECSMFASSKEAANELAFNVAVTQLNCLFSNEPYETSCDPACENLVDVSFSIYFAGNTHTGVHAGPVFVGTETAEVPGGIYRSACSQEQANAQAEELAKAQLVCLWANNTQTASCPTLPNGSSYHSTAVTSATIPEGTIISDKCTPYANEIALRMAAMQLFCAVPNDEQKEDECPDGFKLVSEGHVEAGLIIALSKSAANSIAKGIATASKICEQEFFENVEQKDDECPSGDSGGIDGCTGGGGSQITYRLVEAGLVPAGTVIALSQEKADSIAKSIATSSKICEQVFFANDRQYDDKCPKGYELKELGEVDACSVVAPQKSIADAIAKGIAKSSKVCEQIFYENDSQYDDKCPDKYKLIEAGEVEAGAVIALTKEKANRIASGIAKASKICEQIFYENDRQYDDKCPSAYSGSDECGAGGGGGSVEYRLVEAGVVEAGTITALTKEKANAIALGIAKASKVCEQVYYGNDPQYDDICPDKYELKEPGQVDACTVVAPQKHLANRIAEGIAKATKICELIFYENDWQYDDKCPDKYKLIEAGEVEAGAVIALTKEKANRIASGIAKASKICEQIFYENDRQYDGECPASGSGGGDVCAGGGGGGIIQYRLVEAGVVEAGTITALTKEKANQIALGLAKSSKVCEQVYYGNDTQSDDTCPVGYELKEAGVVDSCTVVAPQKGLANAIARGIAKAIKVCELIFYDNRGQNDSSCPPGYKLVEAGEVGPGEIITTDQSKSDRIAAGIAKATKICEQIFYENDYQRDSSCPPKYKLIEAGVVQAGEVVATKKEKANAVAKGIAKAIKVCELIFYENSTQRSTECPNPAGGGDSCTGGGGLEYRLVEAGVVHAGTVLALSQEKADSIALGLAKASKVCEQVLHGNDAQNDSKCPDKFELEIAGEIGACEVVAPTKAQANKIALGIAKANKVCVPKLYENDGQSYCGCPAGWIADECGYIGPGEISAMTKAAANALAASIARASVVCKMVMYCNTTHTSQKCPPGYEKESDGVVGAGSYCLPSQEAAQAIAAAIADSLVVCKMKLYGNAYKKGSVSCSTGEEAYNHEVSGGTIQLPTQEAADSAAGGIASALSFCKPKMLSAPTSGIWVYGSVNGEVQWLPTQGC